MLKKSLALMLVCSLVAAPSFASTFFKHGIRDKQFLQAPIKASKTQTAKNCTDFSGIWKGSCTNKNGQEVVTIQSDESRFKVNEKTYYIGSGLTTNSEGASWSTAFEHETLFWNEDKTQIIMNGTSVMRFHPEGIERYTEELLNVLTQAVVSLVDGKLIVEQKDIFSLGADKMDEEHFVCTYVRDAS